MPDRYPLPEHGFALAFDGAFHGHVVEQFDCVLLRRSHLSIDLYKSFVSTRDRFHDEEQDTDCRFLARYVIDHEGIIRQPMRMPIIRFALSRPIPSPL